MKGDNWVRIGCLLVCWGLIGSGALFARQGLEAQKKATATLPFTVELVEVDVSSFSVPALHSFSYAKANGKWLIVGGRTDGRHTFGMNAFPVESENDDIWVIDPATWNVWSASVNGLSDALADVLSSTNMQFAQYGDYLYLVGGYGQDSGLESMVTFPTLTALHVSNLMNAVINGTDISGHIRQITDARLKVTGGEMKMIGDRFYLTFGHLFDGKYSSSGGTFTQAYTEEVRIFRIQDDGTTMSIADYETLTHADEFHRRDFTLAPMVYPDESLGLGAYAGVFQETVDLPFLNPIYVSEAAGTGNPAYTIDTAFDQLMSHYTCPAVPLFDISSGAMHTTFFGGIGQNYIDDVSGNMVQDDLVPFIKEVTTLTRTSGGTSSEHIWPFELPTLLGANMAFFLDDAVPHYANGVIKLNQVVGRTKVGHLFGGIHAFGLNLFPSVATNRVFEVYVDNPALPVELTSFEGYANGTAVVLQWATASEQNNAGFEVEMRSEEAAPWLVHGLVPGQGTSAEGQTYTYRVENLTPGQHHFRLKQLDFDGAYTYSSEVEVFIEAPGGYHLTAAYPNPFNPTTSFTLSMNRRQRVQIAVYDALGRLVTQLHDGILSGNTAHRFTFEAANLPSGNYLIQVTGKTFRTAQRVMLLK